MATKKPIPVADRPDLKLAADFLERLSAQLTAEYPFLDVARGWREDLASDAWRHARTLRRIACTNRAGHAILRGDARCPACDALPSEDAVQP